jgi:hypothetical protein
LKSKKENKSGKFAGSKSKYVSIIEEIVICMSKQVQGPRAEMFREHTLLVDVPKILLEFHNYV